MIKHQRSKSDQPKESAKLEDDDDEIQYKDEPDVVITKKNKMIFTGSSKPELKTNFLDSNEALIKGGIKIKLKKADPTEDPEVNQNKR